VTGDGSPSINADAASRIWSQFIPDRSLHNADQFPDSIEPIPRLSLASVMGPPRCHEHGTTWKCQ
jgi:hypothetical protein